MRRICWVLLAAALIATACGDSDDASVSTTVPGAGADATADGGASGDTTTTVAPATTNAAPETTVADDSTDVASDVEEDTTSPTSVMPSLDRDAVEFGARSRGDLRFVFIGHARTPDSPFWTIVRRGVSAAAADLGVEVTEVFDSDLEIRLEAVRQATADRVDGLALTLTNPEEQRADVMAAVASGIDVVNVNTGDVETFDVGGYAYIGQTEDIAALSAGKTLEVLGVTHLLCVNPVPSIVELQQRCDGAGAEVGQLTTVAFDGDETGSLTEAQVAAAIAADPTIDGVLTTTVGDALPALAALRAAGSTAVLGTYDLTPEVLDVIDAGDIAFAVNQQPFVQGYLAVVSMFLRARNLSELGGGVPVLTGPSIVTATNTAEARTQLLPAGELETMAPVDLSFVTHANPDGSSVFWSLMETGIADAAADFGVEVTLRRDSDRATEAALVREEIDRRPDALSMTLPEPTLLTPPAQEAVAAGIPTYVVNAGISELTSSGAVTFVGQNEILAGRQLGRELTAQGFQNGICVVQAPNQGIRDRCAGVEESFQGSMSTLEFDVFSVDDGDQRIQELVVSAVETDPAIDILVVTGRFQSEGQSQALAAAGLTRPIATFDIAESILTDLVGGSIVASVDQQPYLQGYLGVLLPALQLRFGADFTPAPILTGPSLITTPDDASTIFNLTRAGLR